MQTIKLLISHPNPPLRLLFYAILLSFILLAFRMQIHQSFFYAFLLWNLFLAIIPYSLSYYIVSRPTLSKLIKIGLLMLWMLFLPNTSYIITDLLHLKYATSKMLWLDVLMLSSFAMNGLFFFVLSLRHFEHLLAQFFNKKIHYSSLPICLLTAFGMYIGRFLRFNSWDIIQNPQSLSLAVFDIITSPKQHYEAWFFTATFGCFLYLIYYLTLHLKLKPSAHNT
ncbi:MAG: DUF1361 domain-containing protein [Flavobacteriaceae bacterium]|nr:DUF1361 domain-containing protein [Flavobacteriaceae bacterium]